MRPDVVLFGEMLPEDAISMLQREAERGFEAVINVGTSGMFPYIQEPTALARRFGIPTIEINPGETILSADVDYRLALPAGQALDAIWQRMLDA
jgi:NAD-dependent deacetylase